MGTMKEALFGGRLRVRFRVSLKSGLQMCQRMSRALSVK